MSCTLKCERCDTWSDEVPIVHINEDVMNNLTHCVCGKCYHTNIWYLDAPVPILIPYEKIHGVAPEWSRYKK